MAFMLSLKSNPHNPFEDYESWVDFDRKEGHDTAGFLARLVPNYSDLPRTMIDDLVESTIDSIIENPAFAGIYVKVSE